MQLDVVVAWTWGWLCDCAYAPSLLIMMRMMDDDGVRASIDFGDVGSMNF